MVKNIVRVKNDFFNYALTWLIFKNKFFLFAIRLVILALFVAALTYGFLNPSPRTFHFNVGIFWSLFWPFFMAQDSGYEYDRREKGVAAPKYLHRDTVLAYSLWKKGSPA